MSDVAEGLQEEQKYRQFGATDDQINEWKTQQIATFRKANASDQQINDYFGVKDPDTGPMKQYVKDNVAKFEEDRKAADGTKQKEAASFGEYLDAGWEGSVSGLIKAGHMPDTVLPEHAGFMARMLGNVGQLAGDLPAMATGAFGGSMLGAAAGGAIGSVVGGGAGAFAAPAGMRKLLMDHYEKGDIQTAGDFMERLSGVTMETLKGAAVGALTAASGGLAKPVAGAGGALMAELGTMTTAGAAMQGRLPDAQEFVDGAILLGGMHLATGGLPTKLREIYAKTGERPEEVVQAANENPALKQDLQSENPNLPTQAAKVEEPPEASKSTKESDKEEPEDLTKAKDNVLSRLGENAKPEETSWFGPESRNKAYAALVDRLDPLNEAVKASGQDLEDKDNPYIAARNFPGWKAKAEHFMKFGTLDAETAQKNGEGLESILKDVPKDKQEDFTAYALSKRALERGESGFKTGINKEDAQAVVDAHDSEFKDTFKRLVDFSDRIRDYAHKKGLISDFTQENIDEKSEDYIPLMRAQDIDQWTGQVEKGNGGGLYKAMEGSDKQILNPIEQIMTNTMRVVKAGDLNDVAKSFVKMADESGGGILEKIDKPTGADNEITYKDNGETKAFKTRPEYAEAIKSLNSDPGKTALWMKMLQGPASWLRTGTVLNPDFILRHGERSLFIQAVQSKFSGLTDIPKSFAQTLGAIGNIWNEDKSWQEFMSSGGAQSSISGLNDYVKNQDAWNFNKEKDGAVSRAWNAALSPLEYMAHVSDNMARVAEFKRAGGVGGDLETKTSAGFASREITLDYLRAGSQVKAMSSFVPFMNIGIQGTDRLARAWKEDPLGFSARAAAALTLPTVINWAVNRNDSRYQDAPNWEKDLYWIVPLDKWEPAANPADAISRPDDLRKQKPDGTWEVNNGTTLRIAKPFELGVLFASGPERALNAFFDKNPRAFDEFQQTVLHGVIPNVLPTALTPILEQATNKNFFTGRPVISSHAEGLLPEYQYNEYTSTVAKQLGKIIGYVPGLRDIGPKDAKLSSPMVIDNYIHDWSGTMGQYALQIAGKAAQMTGVVPQGTNNPSMSLAEMPVIKAFIVRNPSQNLQPIQDFYEDYEKATRVNATVKDLLKKGDADSVRQAMQVQQENPGDLAKLDTIHKALGAQSKFLQFVNSSPDYSPSDKRQLMDSAYYQMSMIAKQGNQIIDARRKSLNAQQ